MSKTTVRLHTSGLGYVVNQIRRAGVNRTLFDPMEGVPWFWQVPPLIDDNETNRRKSVALRLGHRAVPKPDFFDICSVYRKVSVKDHPIAEFLLLTDKMGEAVQAWWLTHMYVTPVTKTDRNKGLDDLFVLAAGLAVYAHEFTGGTFTLDSGTLTIACTMKGMTIGIVRGRPVGFVRHGMPITEAAWDRLLFSRREYPATGINSGIVKLHSILKDEKYSIGRREECLDIVYLGGILHRRRWAEDSSGHTAEWLTDCAICEETIATRLEGVKEVTSTLVTDKLSRTVYLSSERLTLLEESLAILEDPKLGDVPKLRTVEAYLCPTVMSPKTFRKDFCGKATLAGELLTEELHNRIRLGLRTAILKERGYLATTQEKLDEQRNRRHSRDGTGKRSEVQHGEAPAAPNPFERPGGGAEPA